MLVKLIQMVSNGESREYNKERIITTTNNTSYGWFFFFSRFVVQYTTGICYAVQPGLEETLHHTAVALEYGLHTAGSIYYWY